MLFILLQATATLRHALYETFLHIHQLVVIGTLAALYIHLHTLPTQVIYVQVTILAWVLEVSHCPALLVQTSSLTIESALFGYGYFCIGIMGAPARPLPLILSQETLCESL